MAQPATINPGAWLYTTLISEVFDMKPALLVIDVQKAFFDLDAVTAQSLEHAVEYINAAIALFRAKQLPVIAVQHMDTEDQLVPGADGFGFLANS